MRLALAIAAAACTAPVTARVPVAPAPPPAPALVPGAVASEPAPAPPEVASVDGLSFEPHFPIGDAFGVSTWSEACEVRGALRIRGDVDELLAYLRAWCSGDRVTVLDRIVALVHARTPHLADAVHADAIALAAYRFHGKDAADFLAAHDISPRDLPAAYSALAQPADAIAVIGTHELAGASVADRCAYYGELAANGPSEVTAAALREMPEAAACHLPADLKNCPLVAGNRRPVSWGTIDELRAQVGDEMAACAAMTDIATVSLRDRYPTRAGAGVWSDYLEVLEESAGRYIPATMLPLAVGALERLAREVPCSALDDVHAHAAAIHDLMVGPTEDLATRLRALAAMDEASCKAFRTP